MQKLNSETSASWSPWLAESWRAEGWRPSYYLRDERERLPPHREDCECPRCVEKKEPTR